MSYRDTKAGVTCLTIRTAILRFCGHNSCTDCPLFRFKNHGCWSWAENHPAEAARLMGYEVINDSSTEIDETPTDTSTILDDTPTVSGGTPTKEDNMDKPDKPRLAEVLGVEEDEAWTYPGSIGPYRVHDGIRQYRDREGNWCNCSNEVDLVEIINHPESIIRLPRLTEVELAICRATGAKWVSLDKFVGEHALEVTLWEKKPKEMDGHYTDGGYIAHVYYRKFPSLRHGNLISIEEATP